MTERIKELAFQSYTSFKCSTIPHKGEAEGKPDETREEKVCAADGSGSRERPFQ